MSEHGSEKRTFVRVLYVIVDILMILHKDIKFFYFNEVRTVDLFMSISNFKRTFFKMYDFVACGISFTEICSLLK